MCFVCLSYPDITGRMHSLYITPGTTISYAMGSWCSSTPAGNTSAYTVHITETHGLSNIEFGFPLAAAMLPTSVSKIPQPHSSSTLLVPRSSIHLFIYSSHSTHLPRKRHFHRAPTRTLRRAPRDPKSARERVRRLARTLARIAPPSFGRRLALRA